MIAAGLLPWRVSGAAGVRKSPKNEPAIHGRWLWGFKIFGERGGAGVAPDGGSWDWLLPRHYACFLASCARSQRFFGVVSKVCCVGAAVWRQRHEVARRPRYDRQGVWWAHAVPGHDIHLPAGFAASGGALGWRLPTRISMMTIGPPQHGQQRHGSGAGSSAGACTVIG